MMPGAYLNQIRMLLTDPTSNLVGAALGVSIIVIVLVVIILTLLLFALNPYDKKKRGKKGAKRRKTVTMTRDEFHRLQARLRKARRITGLVVLLGLAVVWVALYAGTSVNAYCGNTCHTMVARSDTWKASPHESVRCVRCHEGRPVDAFVRGSASRLRSLSYAFLGTDATGVKVPSIRCLECHGSILEETVVSELAVAMSHREPISAGASCSDCHGQQGHIETSLIVAMPACLRCHDGVTASAKCTLCHPKGIEASISQPREPVGPSTRLPAKPRCGGCHSQKSCDACHGLRMPHSEDYEKPQRHARPAAFDAKNRLCYRCHTPSECGVCHPSFSAHGLNWKKDHAKYTRKDGNEYCLWCHETKDFCGLCH